MFAMVVAPIGTAVTATGAIVIAVIGTAATDTGTTAIAIIEVREDTAIGTTHGHTTGVRVGAS